LKDKKKVDDLDEDSPEESEDVDDSYTVRVL
jgi:hypothetical protein